MNFEMRETGLKKINSSYKFDNLHSDESQGKNQGNCTVTIEDDSASFYPTITLDAKLNRNASNISQEEAFLSHWIEKYSISFITEWTKTINFRIWAVEHNPKIRCMSEYSGYFDEVTIHYENGTVYKGALYKGKKLTKADTF